MYSQYRRIQTSASIPRIKLLRFLGNTNWKTTYATIMFGDIDEVPSDHPADTDSEKLHKQDMVECALATAGSSTLEASVISSQRCDIQERSEQCKEQERFHTGSGQ